MGLTNFFKKVFRKKFETEETTHPQEISLEEIDKWIKNKEDETKRKEEKIIKASQEKISDSINELNKKIKDLEAVNVDSIKSQEKIKLIVKENLKKYLEDVNNFTHNLSRFSELSETKVETLNSFFTNLDRLFLEFERRSYRNYEKATILIGKEGGEVRRAIKRLYDQLKRVFEENEGIINISNSLSITKETLGKVSNLKRFILDLEKKKYFFDEKIKSIKEENKKTFERIEETKKSKEYLEWLKEKEHLEPLKKELERGIFSLKDIIDFKYLGGIFHVDEKKMRIVKSHKENFPEHFKKDQYSRILALINETSHKNKKEISKKISQIKNKKAEITEMESSIKQDPLKEKFSKIEKNNLETKNLENEKEKIQKSYKKIEEKKQKFFEEIIKESERLGIVVKKENNS